MGALNGNSDVAIGNVVGSNIFNILGILGITALFSPIAICKNNLKFEIPFCIGVSILLTFFAFNYFNNTSPIISRLDGILLLIVFAVFMWYSFTRGRETDAITAVEVENTTSLWMVVIKVIGGLALLVTSCDFFVDNAVLVAKSFGVSDAFVSLTLIACGTSLPELAASVVAAVKKNTDMALGNIIGSNIFNITLILGVSSQIMPLTSSRITCVDYGVMIVAAILPLIIGFRGRIGRVSGLFMLLGFIVYNLYLVTNQIS